jgi:hypothetical protein
MQHPLPGCTGRSGGGNAMAVMLGMPESFKQNDLDNVTAYTGKLVKEEVGLPLVKIRNEALQPRSVVRKGAAQIEFEDRP